MKNLFTALLVFLYGISAAQSVPSDSRITLDSAKKYINNYQKKFHPGTSPHIPCFFLLNVSGIKSYIAGMTSGNRYLHVYIAKTASSGGSYLLAFVAADVDYNVDSFENYYDAQVWATGQAEPTCCNNYDSNIDGPASGSGCSFNGGCSTNIFSINGSYNDVRQYIANYQRPITQLRAFLMNADDFSNFLAANSSVAYIEAYMAIDGNQVPKLVLVGVTSSGNHVYYSTGGASYVLDESIPCPQCAGMDQYIDVYQATPFAR